MSVYSLSFSQITFNESAECFEEEPINNTYLQEKISMTENAQDNNRFTTEASARCMFEFKNNELWCSLWKFLFNSTLKILT